MSRAFRSWFRFPEREDMGAVEARLARELGLVPGRRLTSLQDAVDQINALNAQRGLATEKEIPNE